MSGWETAGGTKKKTGSKKETSKQQQAAVDKALKRNAPVEGTKTLFDIFNDVDADKQKKKETQVSTHKLSTHNLPLLYP